MSAFTFVCGLVWLCVTVGAQKGAYDDQLEVLKTLLNKSDYNRNSPPAGGPTNVKIGMFINEIDGPDIMDMEYGMSWYLRMSWTDNRLAHGQPETIKAPDGFWDQIWTPDVFLRNEKEASAQSMITPHRLLRIDANGSVWYVIKYSTRLTCYMDLQRYPMDTQSCGVFFESFGYTMTDMTFSWLVNPVEWDGSALHHYSLAETVLVDCSQNYTGGQFPCLSVRFILNRESGAYVRFLFIPTVLVVVISWLQFWFSPDVVTGRAIVALLTSLIVLGLIPAARYHFPPVTYTCALDVWLCACCGMCLLGLLELGLVQLLDRRSKEKSSNSSAFAAKIDVASRIIFPIVFLIINIVYWTLYFL